MLGISLKFLLERLLYTPKKAVADHTTFLAVYEHKKTKLLSKKESIFPSSIVLSMLYIFSSQYLQEQFASDISQQ